jgi:hypothetical protein
MAYPIPEKVDGGQPTQPEAPQVMPEPKHTFTNDAPPKQTFSSPDSSVPKPSKPSHVPKTTGWKR